MVVIDSDIDADFVQVLVLGSSSGTLHFLDTFAGLSVLFIIQVQSGPVETLVFRPRRNELVVYGHNIMTRKSEVKVWQLPGMVPTVAISDLVSISSWAVSLTLDLIVLGLDSGYLRVFELLMKDRAVAEVMRQSETHDGSVTAIAFCDPIRVFASASCDGTVKIFTVNKVHVRTIRLIRPSKVVIFADEALVVSQGAYLLSISRSNWDGGRVAHRASAAVEEWTASATADSEADLSASMQSLLENAELRTTTDVEAMAVSSVETSFKVPATMTRAEDAASEDSSRAAVEYYSFLGTNLPTAIYSPSAPKEPLSTKNTLRPKLRAARRPLKFDLANRKEDIALSIKKLKTPCTGVVS